MAATKKFLALAIGPAIGLVAVCFPGQSATHDRFADEVVHLPPAQATPDSARVQAPRRYVQRSGPANASISPLDLSAVKRALDLIRRGKADEATALGKTITQPAAAKLIEWAILRTG